MNDWLMRLRERMFMRDADKGGAAGAAGVVEETAPETTATEGATPEGESEGHSEAYLDALGIPDALRETLKVKKPVKPAAVKPEGEKPPEGETPVVKKPAESDDEFEVPADHAELPHVKRMQSRIGKLTGQRNEARERIQELEGELTKAKDSAGARTAAPAAQGDKGLFAGISSRADLDNLANAARATEDWAEEIERQWETNGGEADVQVDDGKGGKMTLKPADIKAHKRNAARILRDLPNAEKQIALREGYTAEAKKHFAWRDDKNDDRNGFIKAAYEKIPGLKDVADGEFLATILAEGMYQLQAKIKGGTKPAVTKTPVAPPPPLGGAGGAAPKTTTVAATSAAKNNDEALANLKAAGGSEDALAEYYRTAG